MRSATNERDGFGGGAFVWGLLRIRRLGAACGAVSAKPGFGYACRPVDGVSGLGDSASDWAAGVT